MTTSIGLCLAYDKVTFFLPSLPNELWNVKPMLPSNLGRFFVHKQALNAVSSVFLKQQANG